MQRGAEIYNQMLMMLGHEIFDPEIGKRVLVDDAFIVAGDMGCLHTVADSYAEMPARPTKTSRSILTAAGLDIRSSQVS